MRAFADEHDIDLAQSYAYSNGDEDVPFLRTVGRPRALNPGRGLAAAARHYSWPVARFRPRGPRRPVGTGPRRGAGIGGMLGGFAAGAGARRAHAAPGARPSTSASRSAATWAPRWPACGSTSRAPSTWPTRPAVFLFNHQSQLDVLVLAKLLRGGFTGVAKKELAHTPGFGLMFRLADVAFVDRGDPAQARRALEPAVQRLRDGHLAGDRAGGHPLGHAQRSARSRRAPSTSRCRPGCRSCRSSSATPAS